MLVFKSDNKILSILKTNYIAKVMLATEIKQFRGIIIMQAEEKNKLNLI